ncbi:MAG: adenylate/guanylate cyclase domain-containing protein, partial [Anaerolineales bacterium]
PIHSGRTTIGRRADNDIVIADLSASRLHAEVLYDLEQDQLNIRDLGSTNGTYVNRDRLTGLRQLNARDTIRIGEHLISVFRNEPRYVYTAGLSGTQLLTRDVLLESIDQHAVLMYEASKKLNTVLDIDTALKEVSSMIKLALGADRCEVILPEQFDHLREHGFPVTIARMAIERRSVVNIPDIALEDTPVRESASLLRIRSVLCVPVLSGDDVVALIYMYKTVPSERPFDQQDVQLAVAISHQTALTLQRMQLLDRVAEEQRIRLVLQRFVSPAEVEYILQNYQLAGALPGLAEHRVTVLFADIADSTGLAEFLGPKKFGGILTRFYQQMTDIVFRYGGLIDKYLGDGVMAVFGMTAESDGHEEKATLAGLDMLDSIEHLFQDVAEGINIGIGVNTGDVVAGYVGTRQRVELSVLGDTVNVAAGLQDIARPNRLLIGPATQAAVVDLFDTRRVGSIIVKGRMREVQAYEVLRTSKPISMEK